MATSWCKASVEEDRRSIFIYKPGSFVALAPIQGAGEEHSDEQGQVAWAAVYKVWGEAAMRSVLRAGTYDRPVSSRAWGSKPAASPPPPPIEPPFRFQGQDPTGLEGGINLFLNSNNTTGWIDPYGLASFKPCPCTCKKILDNMKTNGRGYGAKSNTAKDGHHIIQDAAARTIPKYSYT